MRGASVCVVVKVKWRQGSDPMDLRRTHAAIVQQRQCVAHFEHSGFSVKRCIYEAMSCHLPSHLQRILNSLHSNLIIEPQTIIESHSTHPPPTMPTTVALAGATGNLGPSILAALLSANHTVTVLTRHGSTSTATLSRHPNLTIKQVDFSSVASLTSALAGIDVVVSCVASAAMGAQNPLIDAAVAAGVSRFIPSEYGMDTLNAKAAELPVCLLKVATQAYLREKVKEKEGGFSWTVVVNGWFLDWVLRDTDMMLDVKGRSATLYNGGDVRFSATLLGDVGRAVVGVIEKREETANRVVYVNSAVVTQKQLLECAKEKYGGEWVAVVKGTKEMLEEIKEALGKGDFEFAYGMMAVVGCSDAEYGCDYSGHTDNELLGR